MSTVAVTRGQRSSWAGVFYQEGEGSARLDLTGATVTAQIVDAGLVFPVTVTSAAQGEATILVNIPDNMRLGTHQMSVTARLASGDVIPWPVLNLQVGA